MRNIIRKLIFLSAAVLTAAALCACSGGAGSGGIGGEDKPAVQPAGEGALPEGAAEGVPAAADFDAALSGEADVTTSVDGTRITQTGTVDETEFTFVIDLSRWEGHTSAEQIVTISQLFWDCYPQMYARFAPVSGAPAEVVLAIENEGYEIAETGGNFVHLHDQWLEEWPTDYDCLTHEFAHVIQNGWDGASLEYDSYIERFADACRYEYAFRDGYYNDACWTLWPVEGEPDRETSVRFLVWLDSGYSTPDNDVLLNYFRVCWEETYPTDRWDEAWAAIFAGSALEGMDIDEVWSLYEKSEFARLSAEAPEGEASELLAAYEVPGRETRP